MVAQRDVITILEDIAANTEGGGGGGGGGDASAANQTTGNASLASIDGKIPAAPATAGNQATTHTKLDTLASHVDGLETLLTNQATAAKQDLIETAIKRLAPLGPGPGTATPSTSKIFGVSFTANQNLNIDITGGLYAGLGTAITAGKLLMLKATTGCFYNWGTGNVTISAASTAATNPQTQGVPMFDGGESPERAPAGTTTLNILGGPVAGTLYVYIAE